MAAFGPIPRMRRKRSVSEYPDMAPPRRQPTRPGRRSRAPAASLLLRKGSWLPATSTRSADVDDSVRRRDIMRWGRNPYPIRGIRPERRHWRRRAASRPAEGDARARTQIPVGS